MKTSYLLATGLLIIGLTSCASKPKTETATTITPSAYPIVLQKESEIDSIETRLNAKRGLTHQGKFQGRVNSDRQMLDKNYAKLGEARLRLEELRNTQDPGLFAVKSAQLDKNIKDLNEDVGFRIGE